MNKQNNKPSKFKHEPGNHQVNNGFWNRHPQDRANIMERACERGRVGNFFDLSPEERGAAYDRD